MRPSVKYYTGIGSRSTPPDVLALMTRIARLLRAENFTLRSGRAAGADQASEEGAGDKGVIYLPWSGFRKKPYKADPGYAGAGGQEVVITEEGADKNWKLLQDKEILHVDPTKVDGPQVRLHGRELHKY